MRLLQIILVVVLKYLIVIRSDSLEIKCDEIKQIAYYDVYNGTVCTFSGVEADSATVFVIRSGNYYEYANKIQEVVFSHTKMEDIPKQLFISFRFLKNLEVNNCDMTDISRHCFEFAGNLLSLKAQNNYFERLPSNLFATAPLLQSIDLSANKLTTLDDKAFAKLTQLETLILSENLIEKINDKLFAPLTSLKKLKLDLNSIEEINDKIFDQNLNLSEIWLNNNRIARIVGNPFDRLTKLKLLNLASNLLVEISVENTFVEKLMLIHNDLTFLKLNKNLKALVASYNKISEIDFNGNVGLLEVKLRYNNITSLKNFAELRELESLDLSFNQIQSLDISTFAKMKSLSRLNLEATKIKPSSLNYGTFSHNNNLTQLDLSYNQLGSIDFSIFTSLQLLSNLKIDGNNLTEIPYAKMKVFFPKLILISLNDNDWNCTYLASMVQALKKMNLVIYVFSLAKVVDSPNVDGIACHNNQTSHVYWRNAVIHQDDEEFGEDYVPHILKTSLAVLKSEFRDLQNSVDNISKQIGRVESSLDSFNLKFNGSHPTSPEKFIDTNSEKYVTQSQIGAIKFFLVITTLTIFTYIGFILGKYVKSKYFRRNFYYPSVAVSTTTLRTSVEQVI